MKIFHRKKGHYGVIAAPSSLLLLGAAKYDLPIGLILRLREGLHQTLLQIINTHC